jgi:DNA-binding transcriptional LysR family regulator
MFVSTCGHRQAACRQPSSPAANSISLARHTDAPVALYEQKLFTQSYLSAVRSDHPCAHQPLTLDRFLELRHILISLSEDTVGPVDKALDERGLRRNIAVSVPYFHIALALVAASDLIATIPERLARTWHERTHATEEHRWLRAAVQRACRPLASTV